MLTAFPVDDKIIVDNLNIFKKRSKPKKQGETGQIVQVARPMPASKVMLVCANCKTPRASDIAPKEAAKSRYCKKCKATI